MGVYETPNQATVARLAFASSAKSHSSITCDAIEEAEEDVISKAFHRSLPQWIEDPVIRQWRTPTHQVHDVLSEANSLYHQWKSTQEASAQSFPFAAAPYAVWLDTGRVLADTGLPWHSNQVNLPEELDSSWPFHFKAYETQALQAMGSRVGDPNPSGYISNYSEANCYCVRALQQELGKFYPDKRPVLVYDHFDPNLIVSFEKFFGLQTHRTDLSSGSEAVLLDLMEVTSYAARPIVFVATLGNAGTGSDDIKTIAEISDRIPTLLHLDLFRSFNYITTMPGSERRNQDLERFRLMLKDPNQSLRTVDGLVVASTMVAGSLNGCCDAPAAALKPVGLGGRPVRVAYIRAYDSTLAGSRDTIPPLWLATYEMRLGDSGTRELCKYLNDVRSELMSMLQSWGILTEVRPYCLDILVTSATLAQQQILLQMGGNLGANGHIVLTVQPGFRVTDLAPLFQRATSLSQRTSLEDKFPLAIVFEDSYPVPDDRLMEIKTTIQSWKVLTPSTAGYPLHMGSQSALGPVVSRFWELSIPKGWLESTSEQLIALRLKSFGIANPSRQRLFRGAFTNGSTMGNRCAIHMALANVPGAFVYFSAETHYSVAKTFRDCDELTRRWSDRRPRYAQIPCLSDGSILVDALVSQALSDKAQCARDGQEYRLVLLANMGTTFLGGRDNLAEIYRGLREVGIAISYIHVDGALDLGFSTCGLKLGHPGAVDTNGMPFIQGVTLSHHKALGHMVSGQVLYYKPKNQMWTPTASTDPRIIFEAWLYHKVFSPKDITLLKNYGLANGEYLQKRLKQLGMATRRHQGSLITVLERPPSWIVEEFSLRPEGDWVHFITMPHVSREAVDLFVDRISSVNTACDIAFRCITPLLEGITKRPTRLKRIHCRGALADQIYKLMPSMVRSSSDGLDAPFNLEVTVKSSMRGALSLAVVNDQGEIELAMMAESLRDQSIYLGPILVKREYFSDEATIVEVAKLLMGILAIYLKVKLRTDGVSYSIYGF